MVKKGRRMFSRAVSVILAASIMVTSNSIMVMAENIQATEQDSSVTEISSVEDFQKIAEDLAGDYVLTEDIDLSGEEYVPIGNNKEPFRGTFDGDGHIISNLGFTVKDTEESSFAGLFGVLEDATVRNLAVENCTIKSETSRGVYAGVIAGKMKNSLVEDVYVSGQIDVEGETSYSIGGITGAVFQNGDDGTLAIEHNGARCVSSVVINVPEDANGEKGTLAGYVEDTALVEHSYSFVLDADLFGVEVSADNSCKRLSENTWGKENSYIGFDFENVWKLTDGGARLIRQTYEKTEEMEAGASSEEAAEDAAAPKAQSETEQTNIVADIAKVSEDAEQDSDDGIMLLASDLVSGDFTYTVSGNNATITGYVGSGGSIVIPDTIGGYYVTAIGNSAFSGMDSITGVTFATTRLESIGYYAFRGTYISSITIPKTVTRCGYNSSSYPSGPFAGATQLNNTFPVDKTIQ